MNGLEIVMLPQQYKGSPILAFAPDMIITTRRIFDIYNKEFSFRRNGKTKVLLTDEENIIFI